MFAERIGVSSETVTQWKRWKLEFVCKKKIAINVKLNVCIIA
jgi:hypothetical protein